MKKEELSFIAAFEKIVPITTFIQSTTVSRAGYYKWKKKKRNAFGMINTRMFLLIS